MFQSKPLKSIRIILYPLALIYGLIVSIRHILFDWNWFKSISFQLPVICVGNISMGGTGKTPHIEYLIELLRDKKNIAVLSRGYKRHTKGFILANKKSTPETIGDEPFQIYRKSKVMVAVCEKRVDGINSLLKKKKKPDLILLDDAFQHRYVKPGFNIVLIDYNKPIFEDFYFPVGYLRDSKKQLKRADIIIVSKTPETFEINEKKKWRKKLNLNKSQKLFFSSIEYDVPCPVFSKSDKFFTLANLYENNASILLVTGIANPKPLENYLTNNNLKFKSIHFPDHHEFTENDMNTLKEAFNTIPGRKKIILTTEKDAVRLKHSAFFPRSLRDKIFYLPIRVKILNDINNKFDNTIIKYATKN